jgi:hypothetical protein
MQVPHPLLPVQMQTYSCTASGVVTTQHTAAVQHGLTLHSPENSTASSLVVQWRPWPKSVCDTSTVDPSQLKHAQT